MFKATIKVDGKITHTKEDCESVYQARKWASVQGKVGFDFVAIGGSRSSYVDADRNATLEIERAQQ